VVRVYATRTLRKVDDWRTIVGHSIMAGRSYKGQGEHSKYVAEVLTRTRSAIVYHRMYEAECVQVTDTPEEFVSKYKVI
jgi:hypothetical protein